MNTTEAKGENSYRCDLEERKTFSDEPCAINLHDSSHSVSNYLLDDLEPRENIYRMTTARFTQGELESTS